METNLILAKKVINRYFSAVRRLEVKHDLFSNFLYTKIVLTYNTRNATDVFKFIPEDILKNWSDNLKNNGFIIGLDRNLKKYGLAVDYAKKEKNEIFINLYNLED